MSTKIVYADIALGAEAHATVSYSNADVARSYTAQAFDGTAVSPITLERNRWLLDGSFSAFSPPYAFWSSTQADSYGDFALIPTIDIVLTDGGDPFPVSSQGISFVFDVEYPTSIRVTWSGTDIETVTETFTPDAPEYFAEKSVSGFDTIKIEVLSAIPGRYARVQKITIGVIRTFGMDVLEKVTAVQETDELTLPISTLSFNLIPKADDNLLFQQKQPMRVETDFGLVSVFYVENARREAVRYVIEAVDALGVLDQTDYPGAKKTAYSAIQWVRDIVNGAFDLTFNVTDQSLTGGVLPGTCREALQNVLFACGWVISTDGTEGLTVFELPTVGSAIPDSRTYFGGHINTELPISKVTVTAHTLYGPTEAGTIEIDGELYQDVTQTYTKTNADATKANEISISNCYLVSPSIMAAVAQRVYDYYAAVNSATCPIVWAGERLGDVLNLTTGWDSLAGNVRKKTLNISNTIKAETTIR